MTEPVQSCSADSASALAARLRKSAEHDAPQELKMVMRRVATALEKESASLGEISHFLGREGVHRDTAYYIAGVITAKYELRRK